MLNLIRSLKNQKLFDVQLDGDLILRFSKIKNEIKYTEFICGSRLRSGIKNINYFIFHINETFSKTQIHEFQIWLEQQILEDL